MRDPIAMRDRGILHDQDFTRPRNFTRPQDFTRPGDFTRQCKVTRQCDFTRAIKTGEMGTEAIIYDTMIDKPPEAPAESETEPDSGSNSGSESEGSEVDIYNDDETIPRSYGGTWPSCQSPSTKPTSSKSLQPRTIYSGCQGISKVGDS